MFARGADSVRISAKFAKEVLMARMTIEFPDDIVEMVTAIS